MTCRWGRSTYLSTLLFNYKYQVQQYQNSKFDPFMSQPLILKLVDLRSECKSMMLVGTTTHTHGFFLLSTSPLKAALLACC